MAIVPQSGTFRLSPISVPISKEVLTNPVIEEYRFEIVD